MSSGRYRNRVTLQRQDLTPRDAMGGLPITWSDLGTRPCKILDVGGGEKVEQSGQISEVQTRIGMRADALTNTLTPADRLLDERNSPAHVYQILRILRQNRDRELVILCERAG